MLVPDLLTVKLALFRQTVVPAGCALIVVGLLTVSNAAVEVPGLHWFGYDHLV